MDIMGTEIDPNRLTRAGLRVLLLKLNKLEKELHQPDITIDQTVQLEQQRDKLTAWLVEQVVISWPFEMPISQESYLDLSLEESTLVDQALTEMLAWLSEQRGKKK